MYVSNGVTSGYHMMYRRNEAAKHSGNFMQTMERKTTEDTPCHSSGEKDITRHPLWAGGYYSELQDKMIEILEKIEKGEKEESFQIGAGSFTEDEWDSFLENFDSIQEVLKALMEERLEKKEEEELKKEQEEKDKQLDKVIEMEVVSLPDAGISFHYNLSTGEMECVDDMNALPGRQVKWSKKLSVEEYDRCQELFARSKGERTWEYTYEAYISYEKFWDMFLNGEIDLTKLEQTE